MLVCLQRRLQLLLQCHCQTQRLCHWHVMHLTRQLLVLLVAWGQAAVRLRPLLPLLLFR